MKTIVSILILVIIGISLNVTNPSQNDFIDFASSEVKKRYPELNFKADQTTDDMERLIVGLGNLFITNFLTEATTRKDYVIFSLYEVNLRTARDFGIEAKNMKILGVAGQFIPLSKDE